MKIIIISEEQQRKGRVGNVLPTTDLPVEQRPTGSLETSDASDVKSKDTQFFIGQKLSSLHTAGHVCMAWWVSSVVFSGTILAAVWLYRDQLRETTFMKWLLFFVLAFFFLGVVSFGGLVIRYLNKFKESLSGFLEGSHEHPLFKTELEFFTKGMWIGTICFALIAITWVVFWLGL